tara:strand:- start:167 stop:1336 length:1170 start_codon:yes stop_codon:yes gene_type:complete
MISGLLSKLRTNIFGKSSGNAGFGSSGFTETDNINLTKSPVSSLDSDPLRFGTYQFPKDVFENQQLGHYMVFYINQQDRQKYDYGDSKLNIDLTGVDLGFRSALALDTGLPAHRNRLKIKRNELTGGSYDSNDDLLSATDYNRNSSAMQQLGKARKTTKRITDSIALYLPGQVTDTTGVTYEDLPTGLVGKVLGDAAGLVKSYNQDDFEKVGQQAAAGLKAFVTEAGRRLLATAAEGLLGAEGAVQGVNKLFGQADNPFVEVLFSGVNIRTFTYNFEFAPRNEVETDEIQQIIQLFRFHMVPELQSQNGRYLTLPSTFDIHYMYKANNGNSYENDYYTRLSTCVLKNCDVNYTPTGVKSFDSGAPTRITMTLAFSETEALTKEKVTQGY